MREWCEATIEFIDQLDRAFAGEIPEEIIKILSKGPLDSHEWMDMVNLVASEIDKIDEAEVKRRMDRSGERMVRYDYY